ncbi:MAG: CDP-diacylglycerol--glycerol-3-phosphate 3-phosphatidyltransferase [Methylocystis sp.]|nr:CDP-diacylglycerol--glycerol-3-phosphate 3-phosphatidyltransferase [Methylocystis sp.]MCA3583493.1 CDP-diacylglycerol--glycerol-3-phosphate 3-phosphatidyltransferase [Methylocystis sp.]MCA3587115.1 CDP-diacylglycerol--glycerol-3-phosphate 3-phosphatidyltransferase [Methylocystis sp.]MCA3592788.1 CDP-diacylglycerol--glycerol-3-phosphate 3-phosphatidyltransferase [Methylocystis sp.]
MTPHRKSHPFSLPNVLTYLRILAVPAIVALLFWPREDEMRWWALGFFVAAAITDYFDGYFARAWHQYSAIGRMLDPIADKLLVAAALLMLVADETITSWSLWAAIIILSREILVSGLREFLAELRVSVPVTQIAKWKTTAQLVAIGFLIAGPAGDAVLPEGWTLQIGLTLLWVAAGLTLYSGWDYFRSGIKHILAEDDKDP